MVMVSDVLKGPSEQPESRIRNYVSQCFLAVKEITSQSVVLNRNVSEGLMLRREQQPESEKMLNEITIAHEDLEPDDQLEVTFFRFFSSSSIKKNEYI